MCRCDAMWLVSVRGFCRSNATITETFFSLIDQTLLFFHLFLFLLFLLFFLIRIQLEWYIWIRCTKMTAPAFAAIFDRTIKTKKLFIKTAGRLYSFIVYIQLWIFGLSDYKIKSSTRINDRITDCFFFSFHSAIFAPFSLQLTAARSLFTFESTAIRNELP